jgi:hypothetical protein
VIASRGCGSKMARLQGVKSNRARQLVDPFLTSSLDSPPLLSLSRPSSLVCSDLLATCIPPSGRIEAMVALGIRNSGIQPSHQTQSHRALPTTTDTPTMFLNARMSSGRCLEKHEGPKWRLLCSQAWSRLISRHHHLDRQGSLL